MCQTVSLGLAVPSLFISSTSIGKSPPDRTDRYTCYHGPGVFLVTLTSTWPLASPHVQLLWPPPPQVSSPDVGCALCITTAVSPIPILFLLPTPSCVLPSSPYSFLLSPGSWLSMCEGVAGREQGRAAVGWALIKALSTNPSLGRDHCSDRSD